MEQFNLDTWLKDKSRKVVTRDGRPVRIVCWDRKTIYWKIIGLVTSPDGSIENPFTYDVNGNESDGCLHDHKNDLFFADDEELTKFEQEIKNWMSEFLLGTEQPIPNKTVKQAAKKFLDLARKQLQPEIDEELDKAYRNQDKVIYIEWYDKGKEDTLKDLPKWKTYKGKLIGNGLIFEDNVNLVLVRNGYYIDINELEKLPKEE